MNILIASLGGTWPVIPETIGFTNPVVLNLYQNHPQIDRINQMRAEYNIEPVDQVWMATTESDFTRKQIEEIRKWHERLSSTGAKIPGFRIWRTAGVSDLTSMEDCRIMKELIWRIVFKASKIKCRNEASTNLYLLLTGGRKTMSSDMQSAGNIFGCRAMLHVIDSNNDKARNIVEMTANLSTPLEGEYSNVVTPIVVAGEIRSSPLMRLRGYFSSGNSNFSTPDAPLNGDPISLRDELRGCELQKNIEERTNCAHNLMFDEMKRRSSKENSSNFRVLYMLPAEDIESLKNFKFGVNKAKRENELEILSRLPKTDLHCHLGGIASPSELIEIAKACEKPLHKHYSMKDLVEAEFRKAVEAGDISTIRGKFSNLKHGIKALRKKFAEKTGCPEWTFSASFILLFECTPDLLEELIYGEFRNEERFAEIGMDKYEQLGDLQGSGLLQTREAIRTACKILLRNAVAQNVRYLEIRCSPMNYTKAGLSGFEVVEAIRSEAQKFRDRIETALIFIASRHRKMSDAYLHIELAEDISEKLPNDYPPLVGFDLAGDEQSKSASEMRNAFLEQMKKCRHITIHAGETDSAKSVWEAVYCLSAERIGHALSLCESPELVGTMLDRKIAIEMCPSSNFQIGCFKDSYLNAVSGCKKGYPLRNYLEKGLRVTVNTDNPGISKTDMSNELHRAARLSPGGLSFYQILQLIHNGFRTSFAPYETRVALRKKAEAEILEIVRPFLKQMHGHDD